MVPRLSILFAFCECERKHSMETLGYHIRQLRNQHDLSLRELAKKLHCSAPFLSDVELGRRYPSKRIMGKIAKIFKISLEELRKYDMRIPTDDLKRLSKEDPKFAILFRTIVDRHPDPDKLLKATKKLGKNDGHKK